MKTLHIHEYCAMGGRSYYRGESFSAAQLAERGATEAEIQRAAFYGCLSEESLPPSADLSEQPDFESPAPAEDADPEQDAPAED